MVNFATDDEHAWRTGRKLGRTIYVQDDTEPSDTDALIGMMDSAELASYVVKAVNEKKRKGKTHSK